MTTTINKIELLAPAGNREKLEIAIHYGADAVYLAGKDFSLRNFSGNFTPGEMEDAISFAHNRGVKVFVACNIYSRNDEQIAISEYLESLGRINPDALIVADPGILSMARTIIPHIDIHLSTQSNTTNINTCLFWEKFGVKRVNLARELPLSDIRQIATGTSLEIETFIHGAMCISYSGRCLLSSFLTDRDSNRGQCSHPCRWKYAVIEEQRPADSHPFMEDERGSYIFNSKDLCMIGHIPELISSGITSLKIEGRMKGINYLASVVKVYREAIDDYYHSPDTYVTRPEWLEELSRINSREYCTGFYFGHPDDTRPNYRDDRPGTIHRFVGKILENTGPCQMRVDVRNRIRVGDDVEILSRKGPAVKDKVHSMRDKKGQTTDCAQPNTQVIVTLSGDYDSDDLIRHATEISYADPGRSRAPKHHRDSE
ncbi:MAG: U32 family peptidase [Proteobacteria bacterium]|nr:U32 family peptidase [Pseudomonadota bacterium]